MLNLVLKIMSPLGGRYNASRREKRREENLVGLASSVLIPPLRASVGNARGLLLGGHNASSNCGLALCECPECAKLTDEAARVLTLEEFYERTWHGQADRQHPVLR